MQVAIGSARGLAIVRGTWRVLVRPVMLRVVALGVAVGIPAFVVSAGNGISAADVLSWLHHSLAARCVLWAGWLVLSAPAMRSVFVAPGSVSLRALRLPHAPRSCALFVLCAVVQGPWLVLFVRGAGWVEGWAALTGAITLGCVRVSALARPRAWALIALGALLIAWDPPALVLAGVGTLCVPFALRAASRYALEQPGLRFKLTRPGSALGALYTVQVLRLLRSERSRLSTALSSAVVGCAAVVLSLRNDPSERPLQRVLAVMAIPLTVASAVCVAPLLENERRLQAMLRSLRVRPRAIVTAFLLAAVTPSSALAAASSVVVSVSARLEQASLGLALCGWAIALGCAVALWGRVLERRATRSVGTFVAGIALISIVAALGASAW